MIEISPSGMALLLAIILLCMVAGWFWSRNLPWSQEAHRVHMPALAGLALGPFLFAMSGVVVLGLLPGASHQTHLLASLCLIAGALLAGWLFGRGRAQRFVPPSEARLTIGELALVAALAFAAAALLFISVFVPLTQNDSLEYATVGRILFEARTLAAYPVLNPETNSAGFFGPWTHPPLYVAAIYLVEIIQGHAQAPGALRLISPWFLLTATGVVYATGALVDRRTGLASALIFLTTPLLFLGAGSALLDALYVSAFALLVAALASIEARPVARGAIVGATIGLGLWTHSVAVLFLPLGLVGLAIHRGVLNVRELTREVAVAVAFALLVGGGWYWRNIVLFGSPISDNPAVFALPSLHWDDYFLINRGLDTPVAMIQYGILKGWFSFEALSITYWGMMVGFAAVLLAGGGKKALFVTLRGSSTIPSRGVLYLAFGLVGVYLAGLIVSVLLGLDLMVKNERYILPMQVLAAIGAGVGYLFVLDKIAIWMNQAAALFRLLGMAVLAVALSIQCGIFARYTLSKNDLNVANVGRQSFSDVLSKVPEYRLTDYLRNEIPSGALVLSLKPSDMYYADRRMVSYLDERLIPFYAIKDPQEGAAYLQKVAIIYVHVPDYGIPSFYNSALYEILRSSKLSDLLVSNIGGQIYRLNPVAEMERSVRYDSALFDVGSDASAIQTVVKEEGFALGGRKATSQINTGTGGESSLQITAGLPLDLFHRHWRTRLRLRMVGSNGQGLLPVSPGAEYAWDIELSGRGAVALLLDFYDQHGVRLSSRQLTTFEMTREMSPRQFGQRFLVPEGGHHVQASLWLSGKTELEIRGSRIAKRRDLRYSQPDPLPKGRGSKG